MNAPQAITAAELELCRDFSPEFVERFERVTAMVELLDLDGIPVPDAVRASLRDLESDIRELVASIESEGPVSAPAVTVH